MSVNIFGCNDMWLYRYWCGYMAVCPWLCRLWRQIVLYKGLSFIPPPLLTSPPPALYLYHRHRLAWEAAIKRGEVKPGTANARGDEGGAKGGKGRGGKAGTGVGVKGGRVVKNAGEGSGESGGVGWVGL